MYTALYILYFYDLNCILLISQCVYKNVIFKFYFTFVSMLRDNKMMLKLNNVNVCPPPRKKE